MAKARYKLGTLLEVSNEDCEMHMYTKVEGIITTCDGFKYLTCEGNTICEENIVSAYRLIVPRKTIMPKKRLKKKEAQIEEQA